MKSFIITNILIALIAMNLHAQDQGSIIIGKEGRKTIFQQNGKLLDHKELGEILKNNQASLKEYKKSKALASTGGVFWLTGFLSTGAGIGLTGLSIITAINDNHDKSSQYLTNAGITVLSGLGLMTVGVVFFSGSASHEKKSVNDYNNSLKQSRIVNATIFVGFTGNGVGVRGRF